MKVTLANLPFDVIDKRGVSGFPDDERGFIYVHEENREVPRSYGDFGDVQRRTWLIRHCAEGWRVDLHSGFGLMEADPKLRGHFPGSAAAAIALNARLTAQQYFER